MKRVIIFAFIILCSIPMHSQIITTEGTDFWVTAGPNWQNTDVDTYTFAAGGKRNCAVTLTNPNTNWTHTINVTANQIATYTLPTTQNANVWHTGSCTILNTGIHVTSTDTIQFYFFNHSGSPCSAGASTILPTPALGTDYIVQNYPVDNYEIANANAYFNILAVEDSTTIHIHITDNTNTSIHTGDNVTITLNAGQVYQVFSAEHNGNFSGTTIHSEDCKPIALFVGATTVRIPSNGQSGDHIYEQSQPITTWSTNDWILTPSLHHNHDYVRITSAADNCQIFINGSSTPAATINTGQTYETNFTTVTRISTSEPASLFQYHDSRHSSAQGGDHGDVSSFVPNPLSMQSRYATFPTFPLNSRSPSVTQYYINIVVPTAETSLLQYNGTSITSTFTPITGSTYSYTRMSISQTGQHRLSTTGSGFIAHTYGAGENWEGYVFSLGGTDSTHSIPLQYNDTIILIDTSFCGSIFHFFTHHFTASVDTIVTVGCSVFHLRLTLSPPTVFRIDTTLCATSFSWRGHTYTATGHYRDTIPATDGGCDTIYNLYIQLVNSYQINTDTAVCTETFLWRGHTLIHSGIYHDTIPGIDGCDTINTLNLTLNPTYNFIVDTAACQPSLQWGDTSLTQTGTHTLHYRTLAGCDSSYTIHLTMLPIYDTTYDTSACYGATLTIDGTDYIVPATANIHSTASNGCDSTIHIRLLPFPQYDTTYYISIPDTESYEWVDGNTYTTTTSTTLIMTDRNGCDSILRLVLDVIITPRAPLIWVPNIFIPTASENNRFQIFSQYVDKMTVTIFHRWGEEVCTFDGLTETWDGTHKGIPCPEGAYVYLIKYHATEIADNAYNHPITGTVLLIR